MPNPGLRNLQPLINQNWMNPNFAAITAGVVAIILYGSLFPFRFYYHVSASGPVASLIATWRVIPGRGDNLSNLLLYVPFGLFATRALLRLSPLARILVITLAGCALSFAIETAQFYDAGRDQGMADVYMNTAGTLLGAIAGAVLTQPLHLPVIGRVEWHPFVFLLLACWLGFRLFPYIPSIDPHAYWHSLRLRPISLLDLYRQSVTWLFIALLLEAILGTARSRAVLAALVPVLLLLRAAVIDTILSSAEVVGGALGALLWVALVSRLRIRAQLVTALFVGNVVLQALEPFKFTSATHPFGWIPFRSVMGA